MVQKQPQKGYMEHKVADRKEGTYHVLVRGRSPMVLSNAVIL